jgi:hypothetical protein
MSLQPSKGRSTAQVQGGCAAGGTFQLGRRCQDRGITLTPGRKAVSKVRNTRYRICSASLPVVWSPVLMPNSDSVAGARIGDITHERIVCMFWFTAASRQAALNH